MRRALLTAFGILALCSVSSTGLTAASAAAPTTSVSSHPSGIGIRLLDIPVATQTDPRARAYIVDNLAPGTAIRRRILVENNTDQVQNVRIYSAAARIKDDSFVGAKADAQDELSRWISAAQPQLSIPPHTSVDDVVTIAVPADAAEGERYAAVWAEVRSAPSNRDGTQVTSISRVGIRVYLSVAPGNGPASNFTIMALTAKTRSDGTPEIIAAVKNTGGRAIDVSGTLSLANGPSGLSAGPFLSQRVTTLVPGSHGDITIPLRGGLPRGPWDATISLSSGLITRTNTTRVSFAIASAPVAMSLSTGWPSPWVLLGIVVLLIIGSTTLILVILRRRRVRSSWGA